MKAVNLIPGRSAAAAAPRAQRRARRTPSSASWPSRCSCSWRRCTLTNRQVDDKQRRARRASRTRGHRRRAGRDEPRSATPSFADLRAKRDRDGQAASPTAASTGRTPCTRSRARPDRRLADVAARHRAPGVSGRAARPARCAPRSHGPRDRARRLHDQPAGGRPRDRRPAPDRRRPARQPLESSREGRRGRWQRPAARLAAPRQGSCRVRSPHVRGARRLLRGAGAAAPADGAPARPAPRRPTGTAGDGLDRRSTTAASTARPAPTTPTTAGGTP